MFIAGCARSANSVRSSMFIAGEARAARTPSGVPCRAQGEQHFTPDGMSLLPPW
jgi:hypothetical protein